VKWNWNDLELGHLPQSKAHRTAVKFELFI
jgi:hypothetical protein